MWFKDSVNGNAWNSDKQVQFWVSGSGTAWTIGFTGDSGNHQLSTVYLTQLLAQAALDALIATFSV